MNGLQGQVKSFSDDYIKVYFPKINETHNIERYNFNVYDVKKKVNIAERLQFPLQLAYGLTIHKSQGMTLESVYIHCDGIFLPGQPSVAIGRAKSSKGVQLHNYRKGLCLQHKHVVTNYYGVQGEAYKEWAICCKNQVVEDNEMCEDLEYIDSDSDWENLELDKLEKIDISKIPLLPPNINIDRIINSIITESPVTPKQVRINEICYGLSKDFLEIFLSKNYSLIEGIMDDNVKEGRMKTQLWTNIMKSYHQYAISEDFKLAVPLLFGYETNLSDDHRY